MMNEANRMRDITGDDEPGAAFPKDPQAPESVEQEIQRKGLTAPRVTPARIDEVIVAEEYWRPGGAGLPQGTLTVCVLTLENGTQITGESACASPENFNAELGQRIAREDAKRKIWALEGYLLKANLTGKLGQTYPPA
jgi:hypothetical protein